MGTYYSAIEVLTLENLPGIINKPVGLVTLGEQTLSVPVTQRDHSIFIMIDGKAKHRAGARFGRQRFIKMNPAMHGSA